MYKNFALLGINQGMNAIFPLLLYPVLVRKLGFALFGEYSIVLTICLFAGVFTDYGFNISGIRNLSAGKNESVLFSTIMTVKVTIMTCLLPVLALAISIVSSNGSFIHVFAGAIGIITGVMLNPTWYFLAKQQLHTTLIPNVISKILALLLCYFLISGPQHYYRLYYIIGGTSLLYGVYCLMISLTKNDLHFQWVSTRSVIAELKEGFSIFVSNLSISFYTQVIFIILAIVSTKIIIGQYALADRIVYIIRQVGGVFSQSFFVEICEFVNKRTSEMKELIEKQFRLFFVGIFAASSLVFIFSSQVMELIAGEPAPLAANILRIIIWIPVIVTANIPFYQALLALNKKADYGKILFMGCFFSVIAGVVLSLFFNGIGAAIANVLVELFITILLVAKAGDILPFTFFSGKGSRSDGSIL